MPDPMTGYYEGLPRAERRDERPGASPPRDVNAELSGLQAEVRVLCQCDLVRRLEQVRARRNQSDSREDERA
jgi:hypothetical protein